MIRWIAPFAAAALALAPAAFAQSSKQDNAPSASRMTPDAFSRQALQSGEKEVSLAELATTKAQAATVKEFARMVVEDHRRVNEQLRLVLRQGAGADRNAAPPAGTEAPPRVAPGAAPSASAEHKKLEGLTGAAFDAAFMAILVEGYAKSVELYETAAQSLPAGAAKKLAEDTLPKIKQHYDQAKSLSGQLGNEKKN